MSTIKTIAPNTPGRNKLDTFQVGTEYELMKTIGSGSYGVVCSAVITKTKQKVAIKKIRNPFEVLTTAKRTLRELKLLLHFNHDNIVGIRDIIHHENTEIFQDVYVVMDLMESDLHHVIRSNQPLSEEHVCYFLYQLLRGLKYIHSANVIHRDLKPSNLLVNENCELKIGDFGMARGLSSSPDHRVFMTEYVATRWYRAPELMLSLSEYGTAIDMWSVGCILAEMIGRKQIFPGRHYLDQLHLIISVLGSPSSELVASIRSERVRSYVLKLPPKKPVSLHSLYPKASTALINLLQDLLEFDPSKRITAESALNHSSFSSYHDMSDEPICPEKFDFKFETNHKQGEPTKEHVKQQVIELVSSYHVKKSRLRKQFVFSTPKPIVAASSDDAFKKPTTTVARKPIIPTQSNDKGKSMETEEVKSSAKIDTTVVIEDSKLEPEVAPKPKTGRGRKGSGLKTISESTKLLVRDTILASMLAKKNGLGKPAEKPKKPITAAERQKEREEKRKKRQERAAEKERKKKEDALKKTPGLSEADKNLLQRWSSMQKTSHTGTAGVVTRKKSKAGATLTRTNSLPPSSPPKDQAMISEEPVTPRRWSMNESSMLPGNREYSKDAFIPMLPNVPASPMVENNISTHTEPTSIVTVVVDQSMSNMHLNLIPPMPALTAIDPKKNPSSSIESKFIEENDHGANFDTYAPITTLPKAQFLPERPTSLQTNFTVNVNNINTEHTTSTGLTPLSAMCASMPATPSNFSFSDKKLVNLSPGTVDLILNQEFEKKNDNTQTMKSDLSGLSLKSLSFKSSSSGEVLTISPGGTSLALRSKHAALTGSFVPETGGFVNNPAISTPVNSFNKDFERYENSVQQTLQDGSRMYNGQPSPSSSKFYNGSVLLSESQIEESAGGGHFIPMFGEENENLYQEPQFNENSTSLDASSGGGYGLGNFQDEVNYGSLQINAMDCDSATSSSSVLANWIELNQVSYDEIDQLQRELELGSPMDLM